jgi:hypothetical protein
MLVDLGGGTLPHPRADVVIDLHHPKNAPAQDAAVVPWQASNGHVLTDGRADEVYSSHFLEHVHRGQPLINVMGEAWRVLKSGGTFLSIMPLVGYTDPHTGAPKSDQIGWQPWSDPTHVNFWWMPEAFYYFCEGAFQAHANYGLKYFRPMGSWIPEEEATRRIDAHRRGQIGSESWWSVRSQWEGVVCLVKP